MEHWQLPTSLFLVTAALGYLCVRAQRTWSKRRTGCGGCGCSKPASITSSNGTQATAFIPTEHLTLRREKIDG